jgi:hypothetical protein
MRGRNRGRRRSQTECIICRDMCIAAQQKHFAIRFQFVSLWLCLQNKTLYCRSSAFFMVVQYFCVLCCVKCKFSSLRHGCGMYIPVCLAVCLSLLCSGDKRALLCITHHTRSSIAVMVQRGFLCKVGVLCAEA